MKNLKALVAVGILLTITSGCSKTCPRKINICKEKIAPLQIIDGNITLHSVSPSILEVSKADLLKVVYNKDEYKRFYEECMTIHYP